MLFLLKILKRLMRLKLRVNNQIMFCLFSNKNLIKSTLCLRIRGNNQKGELYKFLY